MSQGWKSYRLTTVGACALCVVGGCALPDYHLPHGFSSTYYRQLQQSQQFTPVVVPPVEEPPANSPEWLNPLSFRGAPTE